MPEVVAGRAERTPAGIALEKYARVGELLAGQSFSRPETAWQALVQILHDWTQRLGIRRLGPYGVNEADIPRIVAGSRGSSMMCGAGSSMGALFTQIRFARSNVFRCSQIAR